MFIIIEVREETSNVISAYKSTRLTLENHVFDGYLVVEDGKIKAITNKIENMDVIDFGHDRILPGIFDTHNHGAFGYSLLNSVNSSKDEETVLGYLAGIASQGVTSVFPTTVPDLIPIINSISKTKKGSQIRGIHIEGLLWTNRIGEKGLKTHNPEIDLDLAKKIYESAEGNLRLVALAPELPGIDTIIDYFLSRSVHVAFAHSDSNFEQSMRAFDRGITVSTHTGNAMTGLHHRDIGGLGASLFHPNVDCEIICDGKHLCLEMISLFLKIKSTSRFIMISDCTHLSGAPIGRYRLVNNIFANITQEGFAIEDTGRILGSTMPVLYGIYNLVEILKLPLPIVCQMASLNPCRKYGFGDTKGSLNVGKDADFFVINDEYQVKSTYLKGEKIYDCLEDKNLFNPNFTELFDL